MMRLDFTQVDLKLNRHQSFKNVVKKNLSIMTNPYFNTVQLQDRTPDLSLSFPFGMKTHDSLKKI